MDITFKSCLPSDFNFSVENRSKLSTNEITNRTPSKRRRNEENSPSNRTPKRRLQKDESPTPRKNRPWTVFTDLSPSSNTKSQKLSVQRPLCENSRSNGASSTDILSAVSGVLNTPTKNCKTFINSFPSHELYRSENSLSNCTPMKSGVFGNSPSKRTPKCCENSDTGRFETPRTLSLRPVFKEISPNFDTCKSTDRSLFDRLNEVACENSGASVSELTQPAVQYSNPDEPITPTTNFKLLSSLAARCSYINPSVERHLNRRLLLQDEDVPTTTCGSSVSANSSETSCKTSLEPRCEEDAAISLSAMKKDKVERKEKSLGLLSERFMRMFVEFPIEEQCVTINLCEVALELGVEKRRMYDVINILESMKIVTRVCKNKYKWLGKNQLLQVLKELKGQALLLKTSRGLFANKLDDVRTMSHSAERESADLKICSSQECRKDNSLAIICRNFLMLFLTSPDTPLTLDMAAKVLEGRNADNNPGKLKTRVRRLYDISNVLQTLGLLQKTIINDARGRKTAFFYVGPDVLSSEESENGARNNFSRSDNSVQCTTSSTRNSMNRHPSLDAVCQVASLEMQKLIMEQVEPLDFSSESHSNHRIELSNSNDTENLRNTVPCHNVVEIIQTKDGGGISIQNLHSKAPEMANSQTVVISRVQYDALLKAANISSMNNSELHVDNMKNQTSLAFSPTTPLANEKVNSDCSGTLEVNEIEYTDMANSNGTLRKPLETHNITNLITRREVNFYNSYTDSENSMADQSNFQCQPLLADTRRIISDGFSSMHASINDKKTGSLPLGAHSRDNVTLAAAISINEDMVHFPPSTSTVEHCIQEPVPNPNLRLRLIESFERYATPEKYLSTPSVSPYINVHAPHDQNPISSSSKPVHRQLPKHRVGSNVPKALSFSNGISQNSFMNRSTRDLVKEHPSKKDVARKLNMFY